MGAVLELQTKQMELSLQATKIMETVDVLFDPVTTCLCHSASERMEQDRLLIDSLVLCGISVDPQLAATQQGHARTTVMLIGAKGSDGKILDVAREFEKTMSY
jgi:Asp-tRNA(Asn)/Glu-tRNA(Gln) amidotransferase A subunit family amidase